MVYSVLWYIMVCVYTYIYIYICAIPLMLEMRSITYPKLWELWYTPYYGKPREPKRPP